MKKMVSSSLQRRIALRRKVKKSSIIIDSLLYIYKLKLKLEAIKREYSNLMEIKRQYIYLMEHIQVPEEVKVEKIGETFLVKVICKKGDQNKLVSILEVFDEMGVNVVQASVSCNYYFSMEAIVAPQNPAEAMDVRQVIQLISKAIDK
ncbi:hypothetical protein Q3G72_017005 [Acer saccharum]|nr:hypothetical protein Q3G72_017005 [Acer saccharum]